MRFLQHSAFKKKKKNREQGETGRSKKVWNSEHQIEGKISWETLKKESEKQVKDPERAVYLELEMERSTKRFPYYIKLSMDGEICCAKSSEPIALHEIRATPNDFVKLQFPTLNTDQIISRCI